MKLRLYLLLLFLTGLLFSSCLTTPQDSGMIKNDYYGVMFPKEFSGWRYSKTQHFSSNGDDTGYHFSNVNDSNTILSVFLYPAGESLTTAEVTKHQEKVINAILPYYDNCEIVMNREGLFTPGEVGYPYNLKVLECEKDGDSMLAYACLFYINNFYVKIRITVPLEGSDIYGDDIGIFLKQLNLSLSDN